MKAPTEKPAVLIIVENLPVPLDRRVWQECAALKEAGYKVIVICPQMKGLNVPEEEIDGIHIYRHRIVLGSTRLAWIFCGVCQCTLGRDEIGLESLPDAQVPNHSHVQSSGLNVFCSLAL